MGQPTCRRGGMPRPLFLLALSAMVAMLLAAYGNTLNAPFVFDDLPNIVENPHVRLHSLAPAALGKAAFASPHPRRWLANISFALNFFFDRYHPTGYHLVNITIHLATGILLFLLFRTTLRLPALVDSNSESNDLIALFAVALWALHPVQTEAVTYIVQRMTGLATLFTVLALLLYCHGRLAHGARQYLFWSGAGLAWLLAMGGKEIAAPLPLLILLYEWFFFQNLNRTWPRRALAWLLAGLVLFTLIALVCLGGDPLSAISASYAKRDFTLSQRLLTQSRVVLFYLSLLLFPLPSRLNLDHDFPLSVALIDPPTTLLSLVVLTLLLAGVIRMARRHRLASFALLWFFATLLIESSVIGLEMSFEHRLYLPSIFLTLAAAASVLKNPRHARIRIGLLCILCLTLAVWTGQRNRVWADDLSLWSDVVTKSPNKARGYNEVGMHYFELRQPRQAIPFFQQALLIDPDFARARNNLGLCWLAAGRVDAAITEFRRAVAAKPDNGMYHVNLGIAYMERGLTGLANQEIRRGRELRGQRK